MNLPVITTPEAEQDIAEIIAWTKQTSGSTDLFLKNLGKVVQQIGQFPEIHAILLQGARRARLGRTPYNLYYRILADRIEILAVVHGRRDPAAWQQRI